MNTPIYDFVRSYAMKDPLRLHMPGHKGRNILGAEALDITEIPGAGVLYGEEGILAESQRNAAGLFGTQKTLYSTEGSTLAIRAMLTLAIKAAAEKGLSPIIAAGRNAHKAFLTGCALLDLNPVWLYPESSSSLLSCKITAQSLRASLSEMDPRPTALYLTSPDYLGNVLDIAGISAVCRDLNILLLVDNAHGAYLHFLPESQHPIALGADLCCDSAHKTLPVLTGGAYLHISKNAPKILSGWAKDAMSLFASTSPSYLILQSLDICNPILADSFSKDLLPLIESIEAFKKHLRRKGFPIVGDEPLKVTVMPKAAGYTGDALAELLRQENIECEFSDPDHTVLMFSPNSGTKPLEQLYHFFETIPLKEPVLQFPPKLPHGKPAMSPREALLSPCETVPVSKAIGHILAEPGVTCPPAVPIAICGEVLGEDAISAFLYYGIDSVKVVKT